MEGPVFWLSMAYSPAPPTPPPPSLQDPRSEDAPPREYRCHRAWLAWIAPLLLAIFSWASCQAIVGPCNRKAEVINHITGCNEEFDLCNKPSNFYSHLLLFLQLPWSKDPFLKKITCHQRNLIASSGNLRLCFSHISCTGKFAIKMTSLQKLSFPITKLSISL